MSENNDINSNISNKKEGEGKKEEDATKNNNNNDKSSIVPAEKARKQYMVEQELAQFARLYFGRVPEEQICQALKIHRATYYRYLQKLASQQEELLNEHLIESTYAEIGSLRNTLRFIELHLRDILTKKDSLDTDKIEAAELLARISGAQVKMHTQGPIKTVREMPTNFKRKIIRIAETEDDEAVVDATKKKVVGMLEDKGEVTTSEDVAEDRTEV